MELNTSTLIIEAINFIALVWILQRLLYRPLMQTIDRRRQELEQASQRAASLQHEAENLRSNYAERLNRWAEEKRLLQDQLNVELATQRQQAQLVLEKELTAERQRQAILEDRRRAETQRKDQESAIAHASRFATRLCERLASPELTARLLTLLIDDLSKVDFLSRDEVRNDALEQNITYRVLSAHHLDDQQKQCLAKALALPIEAGAYSEDPALLAGLQVHVGPYMMAANLRDELQFFGRLAHIEGNA